MFDKIINKYSDKAKTRKSEKGKNQKIKSLIKKNEENELIIHHYCGYERGGLGLISYDVKQLRNLKESLEQRGYPCTLLENFYCGNRSFKFNLISEYKRDKNIADSMNQFLSFVEKYFVNGKPIPDFDFFNDSEKEILNMWWH